MASSYDNEDGRFFTKIPFAMSAKNQMETLMPKKILCVALLFITCCSVFARFRVPVIYRDVYYYMEPFEKVSYPANRANVYVSRIIDKNQLHRIRLDSMAKSKLKALLFTGDSYAFNQVRLTLIHPGISPGDYGCFLIEDLEDNFSISFTVADYDSVVLKTYINFYNPRWKQFMEPGTDLDYITSAIAVRVLLNRLSGKMDLRNDLPQSFTEEEMARLYMYDPDLNETVRNYYIKNSVENKYKLKSGLSREEEATLRKILDNADLNFSRTFAEKERIEAYDNFIRQMRDYGSPEEIFKKLEEFVQINISMVEDYEINGKWIKPCDLLYTRKGDYKSVAFFYYSVFRDLEYFEENKYAASTFQKLELSYEAYFVAPLEIKEKMDAWKFSTSEELAEELKKHNIADGANLNIRKYQFPEFKNARLLVAFKYNNNWYYTTGRKWIKTQLYQEKGDRTAAHYAKNGCYYLELNEKQAGKIRNGEPLIEKGSSDFGNWNVFLDISNDPQ